MSARHWGPTRKSTREKRVPQRKRAWSTSDESKHPNKKTRRSKTESESAADTTTDVPPPLELEEDPQEFVLRTANMIRRALEWATLTERGAPGHIYTVKMRQDMGAHTISIPALEAAWEALRLSALSQTALSVAFLSEGVLLQVKRIVEVMAAIGGTRDYLLPPNTHNTTRDTILVCGRSFMELAAAAFGFQSRQRNKDVESLGSFAAAAGGEEGNNMPLLRPTCSSLFLANSAVSPLLKWTLLTACASDVPTATSLHFDTVLEALRLSATVCNDFLATAWLSGVDRASAPTMLNGVFGPTAWIADKVHGTLEATGRIFEVYAGNSSWTKKVELGQLEHCEALLDAVLRVLNGLHKADKMNVFQSAGVGALSDAGAFNAAAEVLVTSISLSMLLLFSLDYSALHTCSADKRATFGRLLNDHSTTIHVPADLEDTHKSIILATMVAETKQTTKKKTKKEKPPKMIVDTTRASVIMNGVTDKAPPVVVVGNSSSTATCIFREGEEEEKVISPLSAASAQRPEGIIDMLDKDIEFFGSALGGTRVADILNNKQEEAYIIQELLKTGNDDNGTGENDCNNNDAAAAGDAFNASCSLLTRFAAQEAEKGSFEWIGAELMSRTEECVMDGCGAHDGNNNNSAQRNVIIPPLSNEAICHFSWKEREFVK